MYRTSRRTFTASAAGFAAGLFALPRLGLAQDGEPAPTGYVSTRVRTVESAEQRDAVNDLVLNGFVRDVQSLEGYQGYVLGDVIENPGDSLSILVLENEAQLDGFNTLASEFVAGIEDEVSTVDTVEWSGDLMISAGASASESTPEASAGAGPLTSGYIAMRVHTSLPETDPREFVPLATSDFLPIVSGLEGFRGYLWYPIDGGFVAISLFDSEEAAEESNEAARDWAAEFLTEYTDGDPDVINANVRFANLPILG